MDPYRNPLIRTACAAALLVLASASVSADGLWPTRVGRTDDLLPVDRAFDLGPAMRQGDHIVLSWAIADGYYLYRDRISFADSGTPPADLGPATLPDGETIHDEERGDLQIYRHALVVTLPLAADGSTPHSLLVRYQGCAEAGVCYPPQMKRIDITPDT